MPRRSIVTPDSSNVEDRLGHMRALLASRSYSASLSPQGLAWEFLRRNPDYKKEYADWHAIHANDTVSVHSPMTDKWDLLAGPHDPDIQGTPTTWHFFNLPGLIGRVVFTRKPGSSKVSIRFELSAPLKPQIAAAEKYLRETQEWLVKERGLKARIDGAKYTNVDLVRYLQILDLIELGASNDEIAAICWPGTSNSYPDFQARQLVAKAKRVAKRIRDTGYRDVARMTLPGKGKIRSR